MSVVGLTLGKAAKAIRPAIASAARAATSATTCAVGRERSYQAKPPIRTAARIRKLASSQLPSPPLPLVHAGQVGHPLLRRHHARHVEDAGDLGGEVPATGEDLGRGAVGDDPAFAQQHDALGEGGGELDVVGGDDDPGAAGGQALGQFYEVLLAGAVPAAGRPVEPDQPRPLVPFPPAGESYPQPPPLPLPP